MSIETAWNPLRQPLFRALWLASVASNIGSWMQNVGAAWLMTTLNPSPNYVAMVQAATSLPVFLFGLPAGVIGDLVDRRKFLIITQLWMTIASAALGVLTMLNLTSAGTLLALTFMLGAGNALNAPAWQSIMPELVPPEDLAPAIALNSVGFNIARTVGPALAGILIAFTSPAGAFLLNALSFGGVIWVLYRWPNAEQKSLAAPEPMWGAMIAGLRYVHHAPQMQVVLFRTAIFVVGGSAMWSVLPLLAKLELGGGSGSYGALLAAMGVGAVVGAFLLNRVREMYRVNTVVAGGIVLFSAAISMLGVFTNLVAVCLAMGLVGIAWIAILSSFNTLVQIVVPDWVRSRALAVYILVVQGGLGIGSLVWGPVATRFGIRATFLVAAASQIVCLVVFARLRLVSPDE
ncbi:MAG: MFS transporter [Bryobacteraceae bacterium]